MNNRVTLPLLASILALNGCPKHPSDSIPLLNLSEQAYDKMVGSRDVSAKESIMSSRIQYKDTPSQMQLVYIAGMSDKGNKYVAVEISSSPFVNMDGAENKSCRFVDIGLDQYLDIEECQREVVNLQGQNVTVEMDIAPITSLSYFNSSLNFLLE